MILIAVYLILAIRFYLKCKKLLFGNNMKITRRQLQKIIKEFKIDKDYENLFDFDAGGGDLPPVEPPSNGGGGGDGSGSHYPQILVDKLVNDAGFESDAIIGSPEMCSAQFYSCNISVSGDSQDGSIFIMFSFFRYDAGYTDIVDHTAFECKSQQNVNDLYSKITTLKASVSNKTLSALNRELAKDGSEFITRYMGQGGQV